MIDTEKLRSIWQTGMTLNAMAEKFEVSRSTVANRAKEIGMPPRGHGSRKAPEPPPPPPDDTASRAAAAPAIKRANGCPIRLGQIATIYRIPYAIVRQMAGVVG